jgi:hypothetical protein
MFARLSQEASSIVKHIIELVYFMRGGVTYEEMMRRTPGERHLIEEFLNARLEAEKKNPHPTY